MYGRETLVLTANGAMAVIGFGCGLKAGSTIKSRSGATQRSNDALRNWPFKGPVDHHASLEKIKQYATHVSKDEFGNVLYRHPHNSYSVAYSDGSKFYKSPKGYTKTNYANGEKATELPGVMRIMDKLNGDRVYTYHSDGAVVTHRRNGIVIKENPTGSVETCKGGKLISKWHPPTDLPHN